MTQLQQQKEIQWSKMCVNGFKTWYCLWSSFDHSLYFWVCLEILKVKFLFKNPRGLGV
jgi:hypothetical protein